MGLKPPKNSGATAGEVFALDGSVARAALSLLAPSPTAQHAATASQSAERWTLVQRALGPRLLPLMGHVARERGLAMPRALLHAEAAAKRDSQMAWLRRRAALDAILRALRAAGLDAIVLKGMALARTTYPGATLRVMTDMDLWIEAPSTRDAVAPLVPLGWQVPAWRDLGWSDPSAEIGLAQGTPPLLVEVHAVPKSLHALVPSLTASIAARTTTVEGWRILAPQDQLLHLATHAHFGEYAAGIQSLVDIAWFLSRHGDRIDWKRAADEWTSAGVARSVAIALVAAEQLLGVDTPAAARTVLDTASVRDIARDAAESAWWTHVTGESPSAIFAAESPGAVARDLMKRLRVFLVGTDRLSAGAPRRLARRLLRLTAGAVPRHLSAIARGEYRGAHGAQRRERRARHAALVRALAAPSSGRD